MATIGQIEPEYIIFLALDAAQVLTFRITPESYTTVDTLIKATKDEVMPDLVETYGDQGITGFLETDWRIKRWWLF